MGWKELKDQERQAVLARAAQRGITAEALSSEDDLVVEGRMVLGDKSKLKSTVVRLKGLDDLLARLGPDEADRKAMESSKLRMSQRSHLKLLASRARPKRLDDQDQGRLAHAAVKAYVQGILTRGDLKAMALEDQIEKLIARVDVRYWLFPTVIVRSGSTLTFPGPGVQSLVAFRLIVEPNARIVINRAPVNIDCVHLEVH